MFFFSYSCAMLPNLLSFRLELAMLPYRRELNSQKGVYPYENY